MAANIINLVDKLQLMLDQWSPKIVARFTDCHLKLVKLLGEFVWHRHDSTDEVFLVLEGQLQIDFRNGATTFLVQLPDDVHSRGEEWLDRRARKRLP